MCLFKKRCHHNWVPIYYGRMEKLCKCARCDKTRWFKI